jgi:hypothetical protein
MDIFEQVCGFILKKKTDSLQREIIVIDDAVCPYRTDEANGFTRE